LGVRLTAVSAGEQVAQREAVEITRGQVETCYGVQDFVPAHGSFLDGVYDPEEMIGRMDKISRFP